MSINISYKLFKFGLLILDIIMERTVSQIFFYLGLSSYLCDLENEFSKNYQILPDFLHEIKTKAYIKKI